MRTLIIAVIILLLLSSCSVLSQRQQFVASALTFTTAVKSVDQLNKDGKLTDNELKLLVKSLNAIEKGLDEWKKALDEYEKKVSETQRAVIKKALIDVLLEAAKLRLK